MLPLAEALLPCGSPSPPLLHEVKLSGQGAGGMKLFGSVRRVSWPSIMR